MPGEPLLKSTISIADLFKFVALLATLWIFAQSYERRVMKLELNQERIVETMNEMRDEIKRLR